MNSLLSIIQENDYLLAEIGRIKRIAKPCLDQIETEFPNFTVHTISHSEKVIEILDLLIFDSQDEHFLSEEEVYILLAAAYLHDTGMAFGVVERDGQTLVPKYIRDHHHEISAELVGKYSKESLNLLGQHDPIPFCDEVLKVIRGHRSIVDLNSDEYEDSMSGIRSIRLRLLAALLRLADELDIHRYRMKLNVICVNENSVEVNQSKLHHFKHLYVKGCRIEDGLIGIFYGLPTGNQKKYGPIFDILIQDKIKQVLDEVDSILRQYHIAWRLIDSKYEEDSSVPLMPEEVFDIAVHQFEDNRKQQLQQVQEEYLFVTGRCLTAGSVVNASDPTSGV